MRRSEPTRRRAALALALGLAWVGAAVPPAAAQKAQTPISPGGLASQDGWDIDAILRRSRELDAQTRAVVPDNRRYDAWSRRQEQGRRTEIDRTRSLEMETRQRLESEAAAQRLESMRSSGTPRTSGERITDQETLSRLRYDAERARRSADDAIPQLWRDQR